VIFFTSNFLSNFQPKKYDFDQYKGFFIEKMAQICRIFKNFFSKLPNFYDKFQYGSQ